MDRELLEYYDRELAFLHQLGAEFAGAHAPQAGLLSIQPEGCDDPHVNQLLHGVALLTARVRRKIDDEYPEVSDALLSVLYPHYRRPIPSTAVVQVATPEDPTKVASGLTIAAETYLNSGPTPGYGVRCRFRTCYPVTLWPVKVGPASLVPDRVTVAGKPDRADALLRLGLTCTSQAGWASLQGFDTLRFYLDGRGLDARGADDPVPTSLYESLFNDLCDVWVQGVTAGGEAKTLRLSADAVRPVGFGPDERVLPYPSRSFDGYRLLQEFFAAPNKFLFFDLAGVGGISRQGFAGPVEVLFFLRQAPRTGIEVRTENFRLGCTPVVNLYDLGSEPIPLNHLQTRYAIVPKHGEVGCHEVFSVDRVVSGSYFEGSVEFQPFYGMRHGGVSSAGDTFWFESRRPSLRENDNGTEVELAFTDASFAPRSPAAEDAGGSRGARSPRAETVTAHLTCSNRDLPTHLRRGEESGEFTLEDAAVERVRLLTPPTRPVRPPLGRAAQWRLISQLGLNHLSLVDSETGPAALRELLTLYDFARTDVTRRWVQGVTNVTSRRVSGRTGSRPGNAVVLGLEVTVEFDDDAYAGSWGFVLASVLERFLGAYVTINSFTQMVAARTQREGVWKRWRPRCGDRPLL